MTETPQGALIAAVRSVLAVELGAAAEVVPLAWDASHRHSVESFCQAVARHRVAPLLGPPAPALGLAPEIQDYLSAALRQSRLDALATAGDTVHVSSILAAAGVPYLVLKGVVLAGQTTGSPVARGPGDVDVLVPPEWIGSAVEALVGSGLSRDLAFSPSPESPLFRAVQRSQMELVLCLRGGEVDLHWRLDVARAGLSWQFDELASQAELVSVGGAAIPTLNRMHAAIFNAAHGARDAWSQLRALVDQVRLDRELDEGALRAEAWRVGAGRRVELALALTSLLLGGGDPTVSRPARVAAERMWAWILAGSEPKGRVGAQASARMLAVNLLMQDSPLAVAQRSSTLVWPVREMAARSLGDAGDRHTWLYPAATPYFLPKRALAKVGLISAAR